jgi:DNA-binding CsgD family transcriptional regulator
VLTDENPIQNRVEELLVQLLEHLEHSPQALEPEGQGNYYRQEVVFNICLDGSRYTLTRAQPLSAHHETVSLSPREQEIVRLVCTGLPNKAISDVLEISPWTVGTYLKRIFAKLNVCSRAEMVAKVLQDGLLQKQPLHNPVGP